MTAFETIGFFWTILATGIFTAGILITAVWTITLGLKVALNRYRIGEAMAHTLEEPKSQRISR